RVTFLDVGQGDGSLVDLPDGRLMLIDAGDEKQRPGKRVLLPLLGARRRSRIDVAVLTHGHPDHYGGLQALLDHIAIRELWTTEQAETEEAEGPASSLIRKLRDRGTRIRYPSELCNATHRFGGATVSVLSPCPSFDAGWDPNDNSLVLRMQIGSRA